MPHLHEAAQLVLDTMNEITEIIKKQRHEFYFYLFGFRATFLDLLL